jgi:sugar phosphate isomerase/epimerase
MADIHQASSSKIRRDQPMNLKNTSRRDFLRQSAAGAVGLGMGFEMKGPIPARTGKRHLKDIGLQLLTVSAEMEKDWKTTLRKVAEIGYQYLEFGDAYGGSVPEFKAFVKESGLVCLAGGAAIGEWKKSADAIIESSVELGKKWLMCYWPWEDSPENKTLDDWKRMAESLNPIGEKVRKAGLAFAYHNHDLEFKVTQEKIPYDILLQNTDPSLVGMMIDLYWIEKGGQKPIPYFEKYPGRFPLWHAKDMDKTPDRSFSCVGLGILDFPSIFDKADLAGMKYVFVEHDKPEDGIECARVSFDYLKKLTY